MELDDLKLAWKSVDRRLEQQHALELHIYRDSKVDKARAGLRPLFRGQIIQIICGAMVAIFGALFWTAHIGVFHLMVPGLIVHVYGILMIFFAARTLALIHRIDYSAPVVTIQKQITELSSFYVRHGMAVGLPWWVLWIPFMLVLFGFLGADIWAKTPSVRPWIYINAGVGVAGLLASWWFYTWARHPDRPRLSKFVDDNVTPSSLKRAQHFLDEIAQFEKE